MFSLEQEKLTNELKESRADRYRQIAESLGTRLDPDFHLLEALTPYADQLILRQFSPSRLVKKLGRAGMEMARLGIEIPQELRHVLGEIERGGFEVGVRKESLEPIIARLERLTNRLVLGIIAAAFIVGLAALLSAYRPPGWETWAGVMFGLGFYFAVVLGIYLAWTILRSAISKPDR
jgi:ubiquinone biosynthesis protein